MIDVCPACNKKDALHWWGDREICAQCIHDQLHPIETDPVDAGSLLRGVFQLLGMLGGRVFAMLLMIEIPLVLIAWGGDESGYAFNVYSLFSIVGTAIVVSVGLQRVDQWQDSDFRTAISHGIRKWGPILLALFASSLVILVFTILLVVPGILRALSYLLIVPLIVADDARHVDALSLSHERMLGHRARAFLPWVIVLLPSMMGFGGYFVLRDVLVAESALSSGQELSAAVRGLDVAYAVVYPFLDLPAVLFSLVLHLKLRPRPEVTSKRSRKKPVRERTAQRTATNRKALSGKAQSGKAQSGKAQSSKATSRKAKSGKARTARNTPTRNR
ncbi:MAG: hypothetical protein AAGF12_04930 [Myxococcota bacterium]